MCMTGAFAEELVVPELAAWLVPGGFGPYSAHSTRSITPVMGKCGQPSTKSTPLEVPGMCVVHNLPSMTLMPGGCELHSTHSTDHSTARRNTEIHTGAHVM